MPKQIRKPESNDEIAESRLFYRWNRYKKFISEDVKQELRALGEYTVDAGAVQPAGLSNAVQELIEDVRKFGRLPRCTSKRMRIYCSDEFNLFKRWERHKNSIPGDTRRELETQCQDAVDAFNKVQEFLSLIHI